MQELIRKTVIVLFAIATVVSFATAIPRIIPCTAEREANILKRENLQAEVEQLKQEIAGTKRKIDRFNSSRYFVEQLARANARVAENEIVFIFEE